jgi:hypothetical protein
MVAISSWSTQYRQLPPHTPCAYLQSQLQSMNFLTELGGTTCGEPHIAMEKSNPCGLEKMYKAQEERRIGSHQLKSTKQGIAYQTPRQILQQSRHPLGESNMEHILF